MLHWQSEALILKADKFGDHDAIVHVFSAEHGLSRGVVKAGFATKRRADMQLGTLAEVTFKARMAEHMGSITLEAKHSFAARVMQDPLKLAAVGSMLSLLSASLAEHDPHPELYRKTIHFLQHAVVGEDSLLWLTEYARLEFALLEEVGFGLDLSSCAATGETGDLAYVSPKSARAVSRTAGAPYKERLLPLTEVMRNGHYIADNYKEIWDSLCVSGHFLETSLFPALNRPYPLLRGHFLAVLTRQRGKCHRAAV